MTTLTATILAATASGFAGVAIALAVAILREIRAIHNQISWLATGLKVCDRTRQMEVDTLRRELHDLRRILTRKADVHSIILDGISARTDDLRRIELDHAITADANLTVTIGCLSARHDDAHRKLNRVIHQAREILTLSQLIRKEVNTHMTDLNEITAAIYDAVLAIGEALLAADPDDKAQIAALQQQLAGELAKSEAFRDPERLERTRAFLAAAAAATPAPPDSPPPTGVDDEPAEPGDEPAEPAPITEA